MVIGECVRACATGPFSGAGDFHLELISAATFALGFRMWAMRTKFIDAAKTIIGSVLWAATSALFLTPMLARGVGLPPKLALMLSQRSVTTPFALAVRGSSLPTSACSHERSPSLA
eukprot:COSAG05_NODE_4512_length_1483_cov_1.955202_1_plen_116_part_00